MVSTHDPVQLAGSGRSTAIVGTEGIAFLRNPYDVGQLALRLVAVLVIGMLAAASSNSLWPGHRDMITLAFGVLFLIAIIPIVAYGLLNVVATVVGAVAAIARPRQTVKAMKTVWRTTTSDRVADYVAELDAAMVRLVIEREDIRDVTAVRGWLRPTFEIALRSDREHRISAHPWWRRKLTGLAREARELCLAPGG